MNEILRGARYTFGALVVLTLWSIGAAEFVEWRWEQRVDAEIAVQVDVDEGLLRMGPGLNPFEQRRYERLLEASR